MGNNRSFWVIINKIPLTMMNKAALCLITKDFGDVLHCDFHNGAGIENRWAKVQLSTCHEELIPPYKWVKLYQSDKKVSKFQVFFLM